MRKKVIRAVATGIQMKLVPHALREQLLVHSRRPVLKAKVILLPAVNVDGLRLKLDLIFPRQLERIVLLPMCNVDGIPEYPAQQPSQRPGAARVGVQLLRRFGDQRRALRTHRAEKLGMSKSKPQRTVATHGKPGYSAMFAVAKDPVMSLNVRQKLRKKKVTVALAPVGGIDEKTAPALRSH